MVEDMNSIHPVQDGILLRTLMKKVKKLRLVGRQDDS